jgi:hypothetical protein
LASICIKVACKESFSTLIFSKSLLCFSMLLIFYLVICSFANTPLFSWFLPTTLLWTFAPFPKPLVNFKQIYPFFYNIFISYFHMKKTSRMLVICVLYSTACWNILAVLLCSSKNASSPCTNPSVWNLGLYPLEPIFEKLDFCVKSKFLQIYL